MRIPMKGRDLAVTAGVLYDKRALIRGDASGRNVSSNQAKTLEALEKRMQQFATQLKEKTEFIPANRADIEQIGSGDEG